MGAAAHVVRRAVRGPCSKIDLIAANWNRRLLRRWYGYSQKCNQQTSEDA